MRKIILVISLVSSICAYGAVRDDQIELVGKVYKYDADLVYLKASEGSILMAPRAKVSQKKLHSRKEISIFLTRLEFYQMLAKKRLMSKQKGSVTSKEKNK